MFGSNADNAARDELRRLKLRLFGSGNTQCLNVSTYDPTNSILGGHRNRINRIESTVSTLTNLVYDLQRTIRDMKNQKKVDFVEIKKKK